MSSAPPRIHRDVVSYVRRSARMNPSQARAWERLRSQWVVEVPSGERSTSVAAQARIDPAEIFGRNAELVVEIGSGVGDVVLDYAAAHPEVNYLAFEVFEPAVASTLSGLERYGIENVRLAVTDGAQAVSIALPDSSISQLLTFFPDPWHKARHHKRRLVNHRFAAAVATKLAPGGLWRIATDSTDYAENALNVLQATPGLRPHGDQPVPRWSKRPLTRYEAKGIAAGRAVTDLCFERG